jgi:hypothetical protein
MKKNIILNFFLLSLFSTKTEVQLQKNSLIIKNSLICPEIKKAIIPKKLREEIEKYPDNNDYEINSKKATNLREMKLALCIMIVNTIVTIHDIHNLIEGNYSKIFFDILFTALSVYHFQNCWRKIISIKK